MNPNKIARNAGFLYLLLIPLGIFGILYVPAKLIVAGDISATMNNILENEMLFRMSILSAFLVQFVNLIVVLLLYKIVKGVNKNAAVLMVLFLLLAIPIAFINELNHLAVLALIKQDNASESLISFFLDLHSSGIYIAQIFWGLWLFPMGYLIYKSGYIPKIIGILLMIGCFGYLFDSVVYLLALDIPFTVSEFTFIGELVFPLWLVIAGLRNKVGMAMEN